MKKEDIEAELRKAVEDRAALDKAEVILVKDGLRNIYLQQKHMLKETITEAKRQFDLMVPLAEAVIAVNGWEKFFSPYERVIIKKTADENYYMFSYVVDFILGMKEYKKKEK